MSEYEDDDKKSGKKRSKGFMKEHQSIPEGLRINSMEKTLNRQETLYGSVWNNSITSVLEEQKKMMQERLAPALNVFRNQGIMMVSKTTALEDLRVPLLNDPSPVIGLEGLKNQTATLVGESFLQQKMLDQDNLKIPSGLSTLKETSISSVASTLKQQTMKSQETLHGSAWNNSITSVFVEQKKMMQESLAPTLNAFRDQGITMVPKTSVLEDLKVSVLSDLSPVIGLEGLKDQTMTLVGKSFLQQRMFDQDNFKVSSGLSILKETAMSSVASALKQQTNLIREDWNSTLGILGKQAIGLEKLNQSYLKTASEHLQSDLHSLSGLNSVSMVSSVAIKGFYESAVNDIEDLYRKVTDEKVENNLNSDIELSDKEFLEEFIRYCKQVGSMLNTLNSSAIWDVLQKVVIIHGLYVIALGIAGGSETNHIDNPDIAPIEERNEYNEEENLPEEKHDYEIDVEKNIEDMNIGAGTRT